MTTDLTIAARRELKGVNAVTSLLGSSAEWDTWIWRWRPYVSIEGTGSAGIVLSIRGGWTSPNQHNTAQFPRLQVEVYADVDRDPSLNPLSRTAEEKALAICQVVDAVFHIPQGGVLMWGNGDANDLRIVGSLRLTEPDVVEVPEGDGMVRATVSYGVNLG